MISNDDVVKYAMIENAIPEIDNQLKGLHYLIVGYLFGEYPNIPAEILVNPSYGFKIHTSNYQPDPDMFTIEAFHKCDDIYNLRIWKNSVLEINMNISANDDKNTIILNCQNVLDNLLYSKDVFKSLDTINGRSTKSLFNTAFDTVKISKQYNPNTYSIYIDSTLSSSLAIKNTNGDTFVYWINVLNKLCWKKFNSSQVTQIPIDTDNDIVLLSKITTLILTTAEDILMKNDVSEEINDNSQNEKIPKMMSEAIGVDFMDRYGNVIILDKKNKINDISGLKMMDVDGHLGQYLPNIDVYMAAVKLKNGKTMLHQLNGCISNDNISIDRVYADFRNTIIGKTIVIYDGDLSDGYEKGEVFMAKKFEWVTRDIH